MAEFKREMARRDRQLAEIATAAGAKAAMIGGAPYFMAPLERALVAASVAPLYSFTERRAVDVPQPDGTVRKSQVFQHTGWVFGTAEV